MATTTCGKCGGRRFEVSTISPEKSRYKLHAVQCASCGVPIGVVDYYNIGALIIELGRKLGFKLD